MFYQNIAYTYPIKIEMYILINYALNKTNKKQTEGKREEGAHAR